MVQGIEANHAENREDGLHIMDLRMGDYFVFFNLILNIGATTGYVFQGHWANAGYWFAVAQLNIWLLKLRS